MVLGIMAAHIYLLHLFYVITKCSLGKQNCYVKSESINTQRICKLEQTENKYFNITQMWLSWKTCLIKIAFLLALIIAWGDENVCCKTYVKTSCRELCIRFRFYTSKIQTFWGIVRRIRSRDKLPKNTDRLEYFSQSYNSFS